MGKSKLGHQDSAPYDNLSFFHSIRIFVKEIKNELILLCFQRLRSFVWEVNHIFFDESKTKDSGSF